MPSRPDIGTVYLEVFGRPIAEGALGALDSLEATRLASALTSAIGAEVPIRAVLEARDAGELQRLVEQIGSAMDGSSARWRITQEGDRRFGATLSFSQERMAFMQGLATGSAAYHVAFGLRLKGPIDARALEGAFAATVAAHPVLRLRFASTAEGTIGVSQPRENLPLQLIDLHDPAESTTDERLFAIASEFCNAPFDLERGMTARAALIRREPQDGLLVLAFHHIVMDQWSFEMLLGELATRYNEILDGQAHDTPQTQPAVAGSEPFDYIRWHRHWFREHGFTPQLAYWRSRLEGATRTSYPVERPRPETPGFHGARVRLRLEEQMWQLLEVRARSENATLAMLLFAALCLSLRNHSGSPDITAGLSIANRNRPGAEAFMGSLVNTLAIRLEVLPGMAFAQLLRDARGRFLEAFENQDMPFDLLVRNLQLERSASLSPLFGVLLNVLNTPPAVSRMKGLEVERVEVDRRASQFDMTLTVDRKHTRSIWFEYATELYSREHVSRIADRFQALLEAIAGDINVPVDGLPSVARGEASRLLAWGQGPPVDSGSLSVSRLLLDGTALVPDSTAIVDEREELSFAQLRDEAFRFAGGLAMQGIGPGDRVGLLLGRSVRLPVAIMGTLLRGAALVPLDPDFPAARLRFMIADSAPGIVVSDDGSGLPPEPGTATRIVPISQLLAAGDSWQSREAAPVDAESAAYVLYTSGSSGMPKGVVVPGRALANLLCSMRAQPGLTASDRLLAITTFSFDIALLELLLPIVAGARLVIASRDQALDGERLASLIHEQGITVLQGTPSTWYQLLESGWQGNPGLRALIGGERLPRELAERLRPRICELWNMYGPTETTIWSTCARIESDPGQPIVIGRPIAGTRVVVADAWGRVAGIGVAGEILIAGTGVALGYLGQEAMTAERFRTFPRISTGEIFYRTGDIGRWTGDGLLECLGRMDSQIKVRGYRIEPGEIEAVAATVEGVKRAIVATNSTSEQDVRLALYVEAPGRPEVIAALREELRRRLPDYMVPGTLVAVDAIPLLPNGKTDFARLSALTGSAAASPANEAPLSDHELALQGLWCSLLQRSTVGRHENFFELGGHSLLAMRLVTRIREDLLLHCTLSQVFRNPTIARLGSALQQTSPHTDHSLVPLQLTGDGPPLFCICGVQLYRPLAQHLADRGPVFAAYVPMGDGAGATACDSIEELATQYLVMLREQQPSGPYRLMGFSLGGVIAYEMAQRILGEGGEVKELVILDSDAPGMRFGDHVRALRAALAVGTSGPPAGDDRRFMQSIREYHARRYSGRAVLVQATQAGQHNRSSRWRKLIPSLVHLKLDSDHLAMMAEPRVSELANLLRPHLSDHGQ